MDGSGKSTSRRSPGRPPRTCVPSRPDDSPTICTQGGLVSQNGPEYMTDVPGVVSPGRALPTFTIRVLPRSCTHDAPSSDSWEGTAYSHGQATSSLVLPMHACPVPCVGRGLLHLLQPTPRSATRPGPIRSNQLSHAPCRTTISCPTAGHGPLHASRMNTPAKHLASGQMTDERPGRMDDATTA